MKHKSPCLDLIYKIYKILEDNTTKGYGCEIKEIRIPVQMWQDVLLDEKTMFYLYLDYKNNKANLNDWTIKVDYANQDAYVIIQKSKLAMYDNHKDDEVFNNDLLNCCKVYL